jgi:hypothetical protein
MNIYTLDQVMEVIIPSTVQASNNATVPASRFKLPTQRSLSHKEKSFTRLSMQDIPKDDGLNSTQSLNMEVTC